VPGPARDTLAAAQALAMGIQNADARRLAVPDLNTTVVTMTLTGIAADLRTRSYGAALAGGLAVATILTGAAADYWLIREYQTQRRAQSGGGLLALVTASTATATHRPGTWRQDTPRDERALPGPQTGPAPGSALSDAGSDQHENCVGALERVLQHAGEEARVMAQPPARRRPWPSLAARNCCCPMYRR
jgi:hypothetical protein